MRVGAEEPQIITIAGESGSGKSTLGMLALGFLDADEGEIRYRGQDVGSLRGGSLREYRRSVQAIFQESLRGLQPFLSCRSYPATDAAPFLHDPRPRPRARRLITEALRALRLDPEAVLGKYPHQLSGGQLQRVMLARAFLCGRA